MSRNSFCKLVVFATLLTVVFNAHSSTSNAASTTRQRVYDAKASIESIIIHFGIGLIAKVASGDEALDVGEANELLQLVESGADELGIEIPLDEFHMKLNGEEVPLNLKSLKRGIKIARALWGDRKTTEDYIEFDYIIVMGGKRFLKTSLYEDNHVIQSIAMLTPTKQLTGLRLTLEATEHNFDPDSGKPQETKIRSSLHLKSCNGRFRWGPITRIAQREMSRRSDRILQKMESRVEANVKRGFNIRNSYSLERTIRDILDQI